MNTDTPQNLEVVLDGIENATVAFTGHRPNSLGGYNENSELQVWIKSMLAHVIDALAARGSTWFISGGALGVDTWAAEAVLERKLDLEVAVPFVGQEGQWPDESQARYHHFCANATELTIVSPGSYSGSKMHVRNEYMVDNSDVLVAVWNGARNGSGTGACVSYAETQGKRIIRIDPVTRQISLHEPQVIHEHN